MGHSKALRSNDEAIRMTIALKQLFALEFIEGFLHLAIHNFTIYQFVHVLPHG